MSYIKWVRRRWPRNWRNKNVLQFWRCRNKSKKI